MGDWIGDERRRRGPSFSSALLEAISRATESSQDEASLPNKPKVRIDDYAGAEHLSFKYNSINALQVRTGSSSSSAGDHRHCCCGSSSCKWRNAPTSTSTSNPRPAYAWQGAEVMPKVKEPSPKLKPNKPVSPGSRLASILNSVLVSSWSKSKSQRQESKGVSDCASNSTTSSHSLFARSVSSTASTPASTSSSLHKPKSKDNYQHVARSSKRSSETPPSYHTKHTSSSSSTSSASANKEKNGKIRRWVLFEKNVVASSLRNYSTKVDNSRNLDEEYADSDSSSDLFELNSIYSRDLPVYETTHLETNKAIAKGLL